MDSVYANLLITIANILGIVSNLLGLLQFVVLVRVVMSWVNADPYNAIVRFFFMVTEPVLAPFRNMRLVYRLGMDLSTLFAMLSLQALLFINDNFIRASLYDIGYRIKGF